MKKEEKDKIREEFRERFGCDPNLHKLTFLQQSILQDAVEDYLIQKLEEREREIVERTLKEVEFYKESSKTNKKVLKEAGITDTDKHWLIVNLKVWERIKEKIINSITKT